MSLSDPLGDMLTRIRNGQAAHKSAVSSPASKLRVNVLEVLRREGYIRGFEHQEVGHGELSIELKYAIIAILLVILFIALHVADAFSGVNETVQDGVDRLARLGSVGVFLLAVLANASLIIQVPYTLPLLSASTPEHSDAGSAPSVMRTALISSSIVTCRLPSQSP